MLAVFSYPSLSAMEVAYKKLRADREFQKGLSAVHIRCRASISCAWKARCCTLSTGIPNIEVPPQDAKRPPRVFELRTYESNNGRTLKRKIKMFNDVEIAIFRRCGILPVFFGETIVGRNMPNLTYMVALRRSGRARESLAHVRGDPEWKKLRAMPEYADAEIVSNISNVDLAAVAVFADPLNICRCPHSRFPRRSPRSRKPCLSGC